MEHLLDHDEGDSQEHDVPEDTDGVKKRVHVSTYLTFDVSLDVLVGPWLGYGVVEGVVELHAEVKHLLGRLQNAHHRWRIQVILPVDDTVADLLDLVLHVLNTWSCIVSEKNSY